MVGLSLTSLSMCLNKCCRINIAVGIWRIPSTNTHRSVGANFKMVVGNIGSVGVAKSMASVRSRRRPATARSLDEARWSARSSIYLSHRPLRPGPLRRPPCEPANSARQSATCASVLAATSGLVVGSATILSRVSRTPDSFRGVSMPRVSHVVNHLQSGRRHAFFRFRRTRSRRMHETRH